MGPHLLLCSVRLGKLSLEDQCAWATLKDYTAVENNNQVHCYEGGENCQTEGKSHSGGSGCVFPPCDTA